jgi:hypothetical protein
MHSVQTILSYASEDDKSVLIIVKAVHRRFEQAGSTKNSAEHCSSRLYEQ